MGQKKDIKLVKRILKDETKKEKYTKEELRYMSLWLLEKKVQRRIRKAEKKQQKGFGGLN